jgi:hypothetical protein
MKSGMTPEQWKEAAEACGFSTVEEYRKWLARLRRNERKQAKRNVVSPRFRFALAC